MRKTPLALALLVAAATAALLGTIISESPIKTEAATSGSPGLARAWGENYFGQLGNGTTNTTGCACISTPVQVSLPSGTTVTGIAGGSNHSLALTSSALVLAWGNNGSGQLGNGTTLKAT